MTAEVKPTNCHYCGYCCAFLATVEDGRVTDLVPDPSRYPYDERILAGCRRWRMNLDALDGADRVNHPLRRAGERGGNEWERVGWDEALDDIAARLRALACEHGPETLASAIGGPHASFWPLHRFMNLFGSPNNMGIGQICWNPRIWMDALTFGWTVEADIVPGVTECLFIWGTNPAQSDNSAFWRSILAFARSDAALVVVDPRRTQAAAVADLWLPVRPGTDCTRGATASTSWPSTCGPTRPRTWPRCAACPRTTSCGRRACSGRRAPRRSCRAAGWTRWARTWRPRTAPSAACAP